MRVVWKDSKAEYKSLKYRNIVLQGSPRGWSIGIPGDENLYKSHYCAQNAIDAALGGENPKGPPSEKRKRCGIQVVGKKNKAG